MYSISISFPPLTYILRHFNSFYLTHCSTNTFPLNSLLFNLKHRETRYIACTAKSHPSSHHHSRLSFMVSCLAVNRPPPSRSRSEYILSYPFPVLLTNVFALNSLLTTRPLFGPSRSSPNCFETFYLFWLASFVPFYSVYPLRARKTSGEVQACDLLNISLMLQSSL